MKCKIVWAKIKNTESCNSQTVYFYAKFKIHLPFVTDMNHYNPLVDNSSYNFSTSQPLDATNSTKNRDTERREKKRNESLIAWITHRSSHVDVNVVRSTSCSQNNERKKIKEKMNAIKKRRRWKTEYSFIAQEQRSLLTSVIYIILHGHRHVCLLLCDLY